MACLAVSPARADLVPFEAVYDLTLRAPTLDLNGGEGRIAAVLTRTGCDTVGIDYRFVARFDRDDATVVTEQHTVTVEDRAAGTFVFRTDTVVDGTPESTIRGTARHTATGTSVAIEEPEPGLFELPLSVFPSAHTRDLIAQATAGRTIIETRLYDGDNEAGKRLTTTAIIAPAPATGTKPADAAPAPSSSSAATALQGLRGWRISESYYNIDGAAEGLPLFQTSYTLYENGVSDALTIDTGDYAFSGSLSTLILGKAPADCPEAR